MRGIFSTLQAVSPRSRSRAARIARPWLRFGGVAADRLAAVATSVDMLRTLRAENRTVGDGHDGFRYKHDGEPLASESMTVILRVILHCNFCHASA